MDLRKIPLWLAEIGLLWAGVFVIAAVCVLGLVAAGMALVLHACSRPARVAGPDGSGSDGARLADFRWTETDER